MIKLSALSLKPAAAKTLLKWQTAIDLLPDYSGRVAEGKSKFSARNKPKNATFNHVKEVLTLMCHGARRCAYCEDNVADEVEHIHPKDLYPDMVFSWDNYLYACGPCNGPKNNKFAVITDPPPLLLEVTRPTGSPVVPPAAGAPALINPRVEDPLHFLFLDLLNTFAFTVRDEPAVSAAERLRAAYTIDVLRLNARDYLVQARRTAFGNYRARLHEYVNEKSLGASTADLARRRDELKKVDHRTVWREMQRQHTNYPPLLSLFNAAPEALSW